MENSIIDYCKNLINENNIQELKKYHHELLYETSFEDINPSWEYIFQKIYIHSCLKKKKDIAQWLKNEVFPKLDGIQQIAIRQTFNYGEYLLRK